MELFTQTYRYFSMPLAAIAIVSGCRSMPQNLSLTDAHNSYHSARSKPEVTYLAALELKAADESLIKADHAFSEGGSHRIVEYLAYIAKQQVAIAEETAKLKTAELAVANAAVKRDVIRIRWRPVRLDRAVETKRIDSSACIGCYR